MVKKWLFLMIIQKNIKERNPNWPQISDYLYKISIIGGSRLGKTNSLFNLISYQPDIDKSYMLNN